MKRPNAPAVIATTLIVAVLLVLYALSMGPAMYLTQTDRIDSELFNFIYCPIDSAAAACRPFDVATRWYVNLWMPHRDENPIGSFAPSPDPFAMPQTN